MSGTTRVTIGVIVVVILLAVAAYWYVSKGDAPGPDAVSNPPQMQPVENTTPVAGDSLGERIHGTTLEGSDAVVRDVVATLSARPELVAWMANEDLVRRFVASVHNIAEGTSPRAHLDFLKPRGSFKVVDSGEGFVVDPESWHRYDTATEVFVSIDTAGAARLFAELEPLIDEANSEIAAPGTSFRTTLASAIDRLLAVPVLDGNEVLTPKVVTYVYEDEALEGLSEVDRQLLRMGPANVAKIQAKLRQLKAAFNL